VQARRPLLQSKRSQGSPDAAAELPVLACLPSPLSPITAARWGNLSQNVYRFNEIFTANVKHFIEAAAVIIPPRR
jgi:hypothetical protein